MAKYLIQGSYTQSGVQGLVKEGGSGRADAVRRLGLHRHRLAARGDRDELLDRKRRSAQKNHAGKGKRSTARRSLVTGDSRVES